MSAQTEEYMPLSSLANELGMDRSNLLKYVKKHGIETHKRRTLESRGQRTLAVTHSQAEQIRQMRQQEGFGVEAVAPISDSGEFYIIQVVPELDPRRLKLGFAENVNGRLSQHRTAAPTATVLKSWPCKRAWEKTVMDALTVERCRLIQNEVFECDSLENLLRVADELFNILPDPEGTPQLSEYSPLFESMQ